LVENGADVGEKPFRVDRWCVCKRLQDVGLRSKARPAGRRHFGNWNAVSRDHKGLTGIECAHDRAAFIAQFSLSNLTLHANIVAHVPRRIALTVKIPPNHPTEGIIDQVIPRGLRDNKLRVFVNPTGRFVTGRPKGDAGLTGRKIIADTSAGWRVTAAAAFSGRDPTKVDRSAAYAARYVAKNVVAAGLADRCEVQVACAIGVAHPVSVFVETFGTDKIEGSLIADLVRVHFDLRPAAIIHNLKLRRPIYLTAAYGHFGRPDLDLPWEKTDKAAELRSAGGLKGAVDRELAPLTA
jgi:S-adenosylmethionine synthetase